MEDSESNNNFSFNQSFGKNKKDEKDILNTISIQSFISKNYSHKSPGNSSNLEDIIFKELKENEKSYLDNGIYSKRKIEGSNPNTKRGQNNSLFDSNPFLENSEKNNIYRSDQILSINKHGLYKSFLQSNNLQYSPNKNYIPDSDSEEEKEKNEYEEEEEEEMAPGSFQSSKININNNENNNMNISLRISNPNSINENNNNSRANSIKISNSQNELLSSLKNMNLLEVKKFSIINNFSKLNNILSSRNTISYVKKQYQLLAYSTSNKNNRETIKSLRHSIISKKSINYEEKAKKAKIIQKWWRNVKAICDDKINKIIKLQSVWRGIYSRKYMYGIIYLCYSCQKFYDILSNIIINKVRRLILHLLYINNNREYHIIMDIRKLFNRYQYIKPYFEKWKCINQLFLFKAGLNKNIIIKQRNIDPKESIELNEYEEYYNPEAKEKINLMEKNNIKMLYLNSVFIKLRSNKIRYVFDCLNQYNKRNILPFKIYSQIPKINGSNNSIKRYFLYKWRNITKNLEIKELKEKFLNYSLLRYRKKSTNNILLKYYNRWKIISQDEKNKVEIIKKVNKVKKIKKGKKIKREKAKKTNQLNELIEISIRIRRDNDIDFIKTLIKNWRFLILVKKFAKQKLVVMYENIKNTYGKINEEIYNYGKMTEAKYNLIYHNSLEDENNFIEHVNKIYNGKAKNNFKYNNYNNNKK